MEGAANKPESIKRNEVPDYSFAFNESRFSDRTLQIVISMEPQEIRYDGATCLQEDDDGNGAIEVKTVQVSSVILAESSQFFYKLFSSGMRETEQRHATIHISPSEEQAFIYLLKFMYGGTIQTQSTEELLDVVKLADKFNVASCIYGCSKALERVSMTMEFASRFLCLPSTLLTTDAMQPIVNATEGFLLTHFSEKQFEEEYMNLPLHIIEQVLKSDDLHVPSEDDIYDFAVNWANRHYHDQNERREVFQNKLIKLIRLPQMTDYKLAKILSNEDMHSASALKLVSEALNFKAGSSSESYNLKEKRFCKRSYKRTPIRAIELHKPKREYRVFWDFILNVEQGQVSEIFYMWGRRFSLLFFSRVCSLYFMSGSEGELPLEYEVFLRSKVPNDNNDFCRVFRGKLTSVYGKNAVVFQLPGNTEKFNFNNVIHVRVVFKQG